MNRRGILPIFPVGLIRAKRVNNGIKSIELLSQHAPQFQ